jgi:hypothetical protein
MGSCDWKYVMNYYFIIPCLDIVQPPCVSLSVWRIYKYPKFTYTLRIPGHFSLLQGYMTPETKCKSEAEEE